MFERAELLMSRKIRPPRINPPTAAPPPMSGPFSSIRNAAAPAPPPTSSTQSSGRTQLLAILGELSRLSAASWAVTNSTRCCIRGANSPVVARPETASDAICGVGWRRS